MSIKLLSGITEIPFKQSMFPDGGNYVKIDIAGEKGNEYDWRVYIKNFLTDNTLTINWVFNGDGEFIQLALVVDAVRRLNKEVKINLNLPYFPGARQDRVCEPGEAFNCKIYAKLLQTLNFNQITCFDPHSDVTYAVLDEYNVKLIDNSNFVREAIRAYLGHPQHLNLNQLITIISPDAGANKKIFKLAKTLPWNNIEVVRADKIRDTKTGKITGTKVFVDELDKNGQMLEFGPLENRTVFVIDDICSKGGTFMALAKELKVGHGVEKVILIVSHYEGTADINSLKESGIDKVYTFNHLGDYDPNEKDKFVEVII